jgi:hypothetical protein
MAGEGPYGPDDYGLTSLPVTLEGHILLNGLMGNQKVFPGFPIVLGVMLRGVSVPDFDGFFLAFTSGECIRFSALVSIM